MSKDHINKDDTNSEFVLNNFDDTSVLKQPGKHDKPCSPFADDNGSMGTYSSNDSNTTFPEMDDVWEIIPPTKTPQKTRHNKNVKRKKREFNPWRELDKVSKKNMTRRDLIRGVFRFLPKDKKDH